MSKAPKKGKPPGKDLAAGQSVRLSKRAMRRQERILGSEREHVWDALIAESDRGCVLVGAAAIDERMKTLLREYFMKAAFPLPAEQAIESLLGDTPTAPLHSLWAKSVLCRALGLIDDEEVNFCDLLREMRNDFAHLPHQVAIIENDLDRLYRSMPMLAFVEERISGAQSEWEVSETVKHLSSNRKKLVRMIVAFCIRLFNAEISINTPGWTGSPARSRDRFGGANDPKRKPATRRRKKP